jgi:hypothetical protein
MPDPHSPSTDEVVRLLQEAAQGGHVTITIMPDTRSRLDRALTLPPQQRSPEIALALTCRLLFGLTFGEACMLLPLLKQTHASKEELHVAISLDGKPVTNIKIVDVMLTRLRRKLAPHGVKIGNIYGVGYRLPETNPRARSQTTRRAWDGYCRRHHTAPAGEGD